LQGFASCCLEAGSICVSSPPNQELLEPFGRSGHPCSHQVVIKALGIPLGSHLPLVSSVLVFVPISPVRYHFLVLQPFRAISFAYFSFRDHSVEFVSWLRSCCWLGLVRVQFMSFSPPFPSISSHRRFIL
jgi:hypothetical protein